MGHAAPSPCADEIKNHQGLPSNATVARDKWAALEKSYWLLWPLSSAFITESILHRPLSHIFPIGKKNHVMQECRHPCIQRLLPFPTMARDKDGHHCLIHFYWLLSSLPANDCHGESCTSTLGSSFLLRTMLSICQVLAMVHVDFVVR
jgi:hypothetical protein